MMHRAAPSRRAAHKGQNDGALMRAVLSGIMGQDALPFALRGQVQNILARRERQYNRAAKRHNKHHNYSGYGLNGPGAVARRLRQIERGQLTAANGLCQ